MDFSVVSPELIKACVLVGAGAVVFRWIHGLAYENRIVGESSVGSTIKRLDGLNERARQQILIEKVSNLAEGAKISNDFMLGSGPERK